MQKIDMQSLPVWDAADHLGTPELQAEYLSIVIEDGNEAEVRSALAAVARAQTRAGISGTTLPAKSETASSSANDDDTAFSSVLKSIKAMGMRLTVHPVQDL